jgi:hypothetical protein
MVSLFRTRVFVNNRQYHYGCPQVSSSAIIRYIIEIP